MGVIPFYQLRWVRDDYQFGIADRLTDIKCWWVGVDYLFGNTKFAVEVSREIRYYTIVEGEGQFFNTAQKFNRYAKKYLSRGTMDKVISQHILDDIIIKEMTSDLSSGEFYKQVDDETLELALIQMWEYQEEWNNRGVLLGVA